MIYLVSACLLGENCKYSGGNNRNQRVLDFCLEAEDGDHCVIPICPETMGGLVSPRAPSEIRGGDGADVLAGRARVVSKTGEDLTEAFLLGANRTLEVVCRAYGLKASPAAEGVPIAESDIAGFAALGTADSIASAAASSITEVMAILKANSPSCGCGSIYDGTFSHVRRPGDGVAAALLKSRGIPVYTEKEISFVSKDENNFEYNEYMERNESNHD